MNEPSSPPCYRFVADEAETIETLHKSVQTLLTRQNLTSKEVHLCAILLRSLERLPLVTETVGLSVSLIRRNDDESWSSLELAIDSESFRMEQTVSEYLPGVGSEHECRTIVSIGVDWREIESGVGSWLKDFKHRATDPEVEVSFDDYHCESQVDWNDDETGEKYWGVLEDDDDDDDAE